MAQRVCPWWLGYFLAGRWRRLYQHPVKLLSPYVRPGMTVLEPGPGMGFFTLDLARLVGPSGRVIAVDVQGRMLDVLKRRAARAGLAERIDARVVQRETMALADLAGTVDFALAFAMVHELPEGNHFFEECAAALKSGAALLLAEPSGHVKPAKFDRELEVAAQAGLTVAERPTIRGSHAALLRAR